MTNQELVEKIRKSSETVPIPESLSPESVELKLREKRRFPYLKYASAAAVLLFCIMTACVWTISKNSSNHPQKAGNSATVSTESTEDDENSKTDTKPERENAGTLYTVASSYDEVYNLLKANAYTRSELQKEAEAERADTGIDAGTDETADTAGYAVLDDTASSQAEKEQNSSYSTTNLQTAGADEGDIIKTDGTYIYTLSKDRIFITDTSGNTLTRASVIELDLDTNDIISEMYVSNGRLILAVQRYNVSLEQQEVSTEEIYTVDESGNNFIPLSDYAVKFGFSNSCKTVLYIYDIANPEKPEFLETFEQDGSYKTSRIIGNIFYLFTEKNLADSNALAKYESGNGSFLPLVNGKHISYDSIYLPKSGSQGLLVSSVDLNNSAEIVDNVMVVHNFVNIYVGAESLYLYHANYDNNEIKTDIAKFSLDNGRFHAVGAASVKGEIYDSFAIHDDQGKLQVLTTYTDSAGEPSNYLYLFDSALKQTGSLSGLAKGETIYAARYFNQTAYFITYRNTDPLFAVDLSDEHNPKLLGQLEITGFSEYLHFWGKNKLLGIGYETDPDTGWQKGIKLVMFDISNPAGLKALDTEVISDAYYSPALYDYKCVLADESENIIGFPAEYNTEDHSLHNNYLVYSWENNQFQQKLKESFDPDIDSGSCRGLYINNTFYIADTAEIISFDRSKNYKKSEKFILEQEN